MKPYRMMRMFSGAEPALSPEQQIQAIFDAGAGGAWYSANDPDTLFQDGFAVTPTAAAGQPIGLRYDRAKGHVIGAEAVTDPGFDNSTAWVLTGNVAITGGEAVFTSARTGHSAYDIDALTLGEWYRSELVISAVSSGSIRAAVSTGGSGELSSNHAAPGTYVGLLYAGGSVPFAGVLSISTTTASVSSFSAKPVAGRHSRQHTTTKRPKLQTTSGRYYFDFDDVDDAMDTPFAASLGGDCTVGRSVPGTGASILTGQTIGASYQDTTDSHALVIVDRALTPAETTALTAYLNAEAGL